MKFFRRWFLTTLMACLMVLAIGESPEAAVSSPVLVFVLAGQSNMEGQAVVDLDGADYNEGRGTLVSVLRDPIVAADFPGMRAPHGGWSFSSHVGVRYQPEDAPVRVGSLGFGYTPYGDGHHFGPELGFGRVLGASVTNPVVLIKTAWGGKSLYEDFRPPSSGGNTGPYYTRMIRDIRTGLERLKKEFPQYSGRGFKVAGLVWYQGWNDGVDPVRAIPAYETNLVNLIHDVRHDLKTPELPVVVGELTGPWIDAPPEWTRLRNAQAAAANLPEFAGTVLFVSTRNFVRRPEDSPNPGHGHHEFGNAETYLRVGDALGRGMLRLMPKPAPEGYWTRTVSGWTVHVRTNLWSSNKSATDSALELLERQLEEIRRKVPPQAVDQLQTVPLWFSSPYPGFQPTAEYHPGADWLREHGRNPAMAKGVEFTDIGDFAGEMDRMPNFALHELAHGYHDRVLGFENPEIQAAYEHARDSGRYEHVERWFGHGKPTTVERAYAMTDAHEYFAESTEAFFSRNDFFPFNRAELASHDPEMYHLLQRVWHDSHSP